MSKCFPKMMDKNKVIANFRKFDDSDKSEALKSWKRFKTTSFDHASCQRPYHIEYTGSRPITEVKQCWA